MTYEYQCDTCHVIIEFRLTVADRKVPEGKPCPGDHCPGSLARIYSTSGINMREDIKATGGFKDVLQRVKSRVPGNKIEIR